MMTIELPTVIMIFFVNGYIVKMSSEILLYEFALDEIASKIKESNFDFVYCDYLDGDNKLECYKPDYSVDTLRSGNYIGNFYCLKGELLNKAKINNFDYDYETILKSTDIAKHVGHVSRILYVENKSNKNNNVIIDDSKTISEFLLKKNIKNKTERIKNSNSLYHVSYTIKGNPLISIIICNKNNIVDLSKCIESIEKRSTYRNYEIIIIDNGSTDKETLLYYKKIKSRKIKVVEYNIPFNYSKMNNKAVEYTKGEHILFLNNDTEVISKNWIQEMLMYSQRDDVGAVGTKLYYPNYRIQHAGIVMDDYGNAYHIYRNEDKEAQEKNDNLHHVRNYLAVTGACMMIEKEKFKDVGGFDESLSVTYNDIDICLKLIDNNYVNVWTPFAELFHFESKTRGYDCLDARKNKRCLDELEIIKNRWKKLLSKGDPYLNPNLIINDNQTNHLA